MLASRPSLLALLLLWGCARPEPGADSGTTDPGSTVDSGAPSERVRLATWNVESLGKPGSAELEATRAILIRMDADVVGLNEIAPSEVRHLEDLAGSLGYPYVVVPSTNPFGDLRNAVISRLPLSEQVVWDSHSLSGDTRANDLTRLPVAVTVTTPGGTAVSVISQHWKSGFDSIDAFRRAVDSHRTAQAASRAPGELVVVLGDVNHQLEDGPGSPSTFRSVPSGTPNGYWLGEDLYAQLQSGIANDPFAPLEGVGLSVLDAQQGDGRWATRDQSDRRIDYVLVNDAALSAWTGAVVYDARDDASITLPLAGDAPARESSLTASDHFPVFADFHLPL